MGGAALAQTIPADFDWRAFFRRETIIREVLMDARRTAPRRRDEPLRELNISDEEVREIERVVRDHLPRVIVNIGPVIAGCSCHEIRECADEVFIQANTTYGSVGLQLSRVNKRWDVSRLQKWWLRKQALDSHESKLNWIEFHEAQWRLVQDFPGCTVATPTPENRASNQAEPRNDEKTTPGQRSSGQTRRL